MLVRAGGCATTLSTVLLSVCARDGVHEQGLADRCEAVVVVVVVGGAGGARKRQTQLRLRWSAAAAVSAEEESLVLKGSRTDDCGSSGEVAVKQTCSEYSTRTSASQWDAGEWEAWMGLLGVLWRCK